LVRTDSYFAASYTSLGREGFPYTKYSEAVSPFAVYSAVQTDSAFTASKLAALTTSGAITTTSSQILSTYFNTLQQLNDIASAQTYNLSVETTVGGSRLATAEKALLLKTLAVGRHSQTFWAAALTR
jgi:hypothetical protein